MDFPAFWIFQNFPGEDHGPPPPLIKGIHKLNPQNLSSTATAAEDKKQPESPPPLKQSTRDLSLGYTNIEKGGGRWDKIDLFCVICNWNV